MTFFVSLVLSLIAIQGSTLNRDGILYVETARIFLESGVGAATATFNWPFLPILMASVSQVSGLSLEISGHLINSLFMAGASALFVASSARLFPQSAWHACLVILALPGLNDYRDELLREYGCWFFVMLAFWLALLWSDKPRWLLAVAIQASLVMAALFRSEALVFFPALIFWQLFEASAGERWHRCLQIGGLPMLGLASVIGLYLTGNLDSSRLLSDIGRLSWARFDAKALAIAPAFIEYAQDQAPRILFYGSLAIVPVAFFKKIGIFILPLLYAFSGKSLREAFTRNRLFSWAFLFHWLVLCVFVLDVQFLEGRFLALLLVFSAPLTGYGLWLLMQRYPGCKSPTIFLIVLIMVSNVVSLSSTKQYFVEAGHWLSKNASDSSRVYIESPRTAYYTGWPLATRRAFASSLTESRSALEAGLENRQYDLIVLEVSHREPDIEAWLARFKLREAARFSNTNGDAVIIAKPIDGD